MAAQPHEASAPRGRGEDPLFAGAGKVRARCRELDWGSTPLGPAEHWPASLRSAVRLCLDARFPMAAWIGPELAFLYNESYAPVVGAEHPWALGRPAREVWGELWERVRPGFERVVERAESTYREDERFVLRRDGREEETVFTFCLTPIRDEAGRVLGALSVHQDNTERERLFSLARRNVRSAQKQAELDRECLQAVLEAIPSAVVLIDAPTRRFSYLNRRAMEIYGIDSMSFDLDAHFEKVGALRSDGMPFPADEMPVHRSLRTGKEIRNDEMVIERADGSRIPVLVSSAPLFDDAGDISKAIVVLEDIADRKRREARLAFLDEITDLSGRLSSAEGLMQAVGEKLGAHLGVKTMNLCEVDEAGSTVTIRHSWGHPGVPDLCRTYRIAAYLSEGFQRASRSGETLVVRDTHTDPRAGTRPYAALGIRSFVTVPFQAMGQWKVLLSFTDEQPRDWRPDEVELLQEVSNRLFPRIERARAEEALRESDRRKDEYLAMLGHELRNPLGAIRNATTLLRLAEMQSPDLRRVIGVLDRQSSHMARIIDGLLDVSRIARGKIHLELAPLDLREVVRNVLDARTAHEETHGLELVVDLPSEPLRIVGDEARLAQILDNLVGNATKFTSPPGTITVSLAREGHRALLRVRDTGAGIPPQALGRIFEPFHQEAQDSARTAGGLGLGLALAKALVDLHHGTLEAHSAGPGTGAVFEMRLPLCAGPEALSAPEPRREDRARRILLVEDNADAAEMLRHLLELRGHDVSMAATGAEALDVLRRQRTDIVLCDLGLPGMSGHDVARTIRRDPALRDLSLVALTGYGQPEDRRRTTESGFDAHLVKPVDLRALHEVLASLPERSA